MRIKGLAAGVSIHVVICLASLAMLYPLLWMLASSFRPNQEIFTSFSICPSSLDFGAYVRGWSGMQVGFGQFFWNSAVVAVAAVVGNVLSCSLAAYAFARLDFRGRKVLFA